MISKHRNLLLIGVILCLLFAGQHLLEFAFKHIPLASEGDCIRFLATPTRYMTMKVLNNDDIRGVSLLQDQEDPDLVTPASYEELRDVGAEQVKCGERNENFY